MINPALLEASYREYTEDLLQWVPDGIIQIDLQQLESLDLLKINNESSAFDDIPIDHSFYIFESHEKITLVNEHFVVWIVPEVIHDIPTTYTLIAVNSDPKPRLELVFSTSGLYNTSRYVLKILESFLEEIQDNEVNITNLK
jgi:hypothetical protein